MRELTGKVAFVTGGASGIGLAMVRSFVAAGMRVVIADIEQTALDEAANEFSENAEVITLRLDVTDREAMETAARTTEQAFGKVHLVCNNAGVALDGSVDTLSYADWDWLIAVNLNGVFNGIRSFVDRVKAHGEGGHFVNTASMAGLMGVSSAACYAASKYAVVGLSETMAAGLAQYDIGVSVLCPGTVDTGIFESERNRPDAYKNDDDLTTVSGGTKGKSQKPNITDGINSMLDASVVGDMVVHAIRENEFYIFTHPRFQATTDVRAKNVHEAMNRWQAYCEEHSIEGS